MAVVADFLTQLWQTGRVAVPDPDPQDWADLLKAERSQTTLCLQHLASEERDSLPGQPPTVDDSAAVWAAECFLTACSLLVHRAHLMETFGHVLMSGLIEPASPATVYSVDLTFRFLPDLHRLAKSAAPADSLTLLLENWACRWPLSSVGLEFVTATEFARHETSDEPAPSESSREDPLTVIAGRLDDWWQNESLRLLYLDRIGVRQDVNRLQDRRVAEAMRAVIGSHSELSSRIAAALRDPPVTA